ncbi:DUF6383 domain-containing protein [Parabacteroides sp.]
MNKKFFTLLAASGLMATAVNAQVITYGADGKPSSDIGGVAITQADPRFHWTPFASTEGANGVASNGVKITELKNIGGVEKKLFQFADKNTGEMLTMQWNNDVKKYQLVLVKPAAGTNIFVDETLWEVTATYVGNSKDLRYTIVNKAYQLPLQLAASNEVLDAGGNVTSYSSPAYISGDVATWSWSSVKKNETDGLNGMLSAAINANTSLVIAKATGTLKYKKGDATSSTNAVDDGVLAIKAVSNDAITGGIEFTAYEAAPVALTASQINAMMTGAETQAPVQFTMDPEIAASSYGNALTSGKLTAWENKYDASTPTNTGVEAKYYELNVNAIEGNVAEGYVILAADAERKQLLRVDTTYHNAAKDARYELRLTTKEAKAPREAYVIQGDYSITGNALVNDVVAAMKKQAQFRFQYYPATQSVLVQALQYTYLDKEAKGSWWKALLAVDKQIGKSTDEYTFNSANLVTTYTAKGAQAPANIIGEVVYNGKSLTPAKTSTEVDGITPAFNNADANKFILSKASGASDKVGVADDTKWYNNLIKLTTLTTDPKHTELTVGYDSRDEEFNGINTLIQLGDYAKKEAAYIPRGYYYIKNGNQSTDLLQNGYYRYHDLAATNYTETRYNDSKGAWDLYMTKDRMAAPYYEMDVETPNTVYSAVKLENIPSAQWYFDGEAGYYTVTNRESRIPEWSHVYMWKVEKDGVEVPNTYACKSYATNANDTIVIEQVPVMDLKAGYLNMSQAEAQLETTVFDFKYATYGSDSMYVSAENNIMKVMAEAGDGFKIERVRLVANDIYTGKEVSYIEDQMYGYPAKKDTLTRAMYRIYTHEVSSETSEGTGLRTRSYVVLEGGKYMLKDVVVSVDKDGYTKFDVKDNAGMTADPRKNFFIKHITPKADEFVLVDPETTTTADAKFKGVRAFVNQQTGVLQPAGLKSQAASNVFDASVFTFSKVTKYNYRDIRREGVARDTVVLFKDGNSAIKLYETTATPGANISLLARDNKEQFTKNFALFLDTANVRNADMPIFLLGLRAVDKDEVSSIPSHNVHISTTADYLMVLTDSAKVNKAYMDTYGNIRLGFVPATHLADDRLVLADGSQTFDLSKKVLTPATFAFRYADKNSDKFYIETADTDGTPAWVKVINEVPVIVKDIKEAEIYNVEATSENPTANDNVTVSNVTVEATTGAVIVKNAAGLKVTVSNLLGQPVASEVLSSDNATIAVPAGVVVVAVEGAEAVKAIVK